MLILEKVLLLEDEDLRELVGLVAENKNKQARWEAFKGSAVKKKLDKDYEITKKYFDYPRGIEALVRAYVQENKQDYDENIQDLRALLKTEIDNLKRNSGRSQKSKGTSSSPVKKIVPIGIIAIFVAGMFALDSFEVMKEKTTVIQATESITRESPVENLESAITQIHEFLSKHKDEQLSNRQTQLTKIWQEKTQSGFLTPMERNLFSKVSSIPYKEFQANRDGYQRLAELNPSRSDYKEKASKYQQLLDDEKRWWAMMKSVPNSYSSCNRQYSETSRMVTSTYGGSPDLNYNIVTGKVSITPGKVSESRNKITSSMDDSVFYKFCATGARWNPRTDACPYYMECISAVYHKKNRLTGSPKVYDFDQVAKIIRDDRLSRGTIKQSVEISLNRHAIGNPNLWLSDVRNFIEACSVVSSTYSGNVVAASIFENVPEVPNFEVARMLGEKAVEGYGECNCVLQNYTGINQTMSIGYCRGDEYFDY